jgi:hypothetical protein
MDAPEIRRNATMTATSWVAVCALVLVMMVVLRLQGRIWWCACGTPTLFSTQVASSHNSQHLLDPYAFSHLLHGIIFYWCLRVFGRRLTVGWKVLIALAVECGWEVLENSPMIIERYRAATASLGYSGDSIVNSTGDVLSCALGLVVAQKIGWKWSIALFVAIELVMLWWIRDNLTLNVIMLIYPIEAIKNWQTQ